MMNVKSKRLFPVQGYVSESAPSSSLDSLWQKDKGKGKAVESPQPDEPNAISAEAEVARLTKELAFKNEVRMQHSYIHTSH
jgi:hypothetical protein